jgi:hypothetical protein
MATRPEEPAQDVKALLHAQLVRNRALRTQPGLDRAHADMLVRLREWQAVRLAATYDDLLRDERYRPAAEFFLSDVYGAQDFTRRDEDVERIYPLMVKVLHEAALQTIALAIEVHALTLELDRKLAAALVASMGRRRKIDDESYADAYRACDNRVERARQIDLVLQVGLALDAVVAKPMLHTTLRLMRKPAQVAGFGALQSFLERGFVAFKHMGGAERFLDTVGTRERRIMQRLFAATRDPFERGR